MIFRFVLQGETESLDTENIKESAKPFTSRKACSFELEVCLLEGISDVKPMVGIRRKRLKGDAWVYKRVCEEVLALTAEAVPTENEQNVESKCLIWVGFVEIIKELYLSVKLDFFRFLTRRKIFGSPGKRRVW